ncbi:glycine cleavage system protein GcvH [Micromonospora sp. CB01531]|uniref:glycine cleavage system protein GcvH n=1 Tax=Micromonospora sp. CB01531 TaxID=1718947 RepID=UPI00093A6933|nr:glycine cleavage system protein GcvH [Micromonospora sp. CB01531]OKI51514.1 glycine cleavage system protein H [Micromonospora sp. CB01531]
MNVPAQLRFTAEHEWLDIEGDCATVGITAFAAEALGDVVYVDLPAVGSSVAAGEACGEIESTKSVSELYAPADGDVVEVNQAVVDDPGLLNLDPFGKGWLFRMRVANIPALHDAAAYKSLTGGE